MYLIEFDCLGIKKRAISTSIKKMEKEIHTFLEQHNLNYNAEEMPNYQWLQTRLLKRPSIQLTLLKTQISIEKLPNL